ncbi:C4-dicarboxylate transporter [Neisseria gonorrhoeae]|uniref:C4-dicarboxylate transporter n=1 Tax=Neisseria gonorrhoeae TaxID=485 RepID=A0A378VV01_NEIGO|nr:C4-dicarboxylate transporter [Neisseria gonorrhoeae]
MMKLGFKPIPLAIAAVLCALVLALPVPDGVKPQAWTLLAMFVGVIAAIIGKVMPLGALSIIAVGLVAVTGVTADKPGAAMSDALSAFANPLIWLIAIAVMISRGLLKQGWGCVSDIVYRRFWKKNAGHRLQSRSFRTAAGSRYPFQYRARRRHYTSDYAVDCRQLRLQSRKRHRRQDG